MADLHGFEVAVEATEEVLRKVLRGAWKSAECPDPPGDSGRIPEFLDIPEDTGPISLGPYAVEDGNIHFPQDELDATMAPDVNGVELKFGMQVQVQLQDPPTPSAELFDMTAEARALVPIGTRAGTLDVGIILDGVPRSDVSVVLTSGDPIAPKLDTLLTEFVHGAYEDGTIPDVITETDRDWKVFGVTVATVDVHAELFDDASDPAHRIEVSRPTPTSVAISIPIYLRIFNLRPSALGGAFLPPEGLEDPMGVETRINLTAPFDTLPGLYRARLDQAVVSSGTLAPAGADVTGSSLEGDNYTTNRSRLPQLDGLIESGIEEQGSNVANGMGPFEIQVPTVAQIEETIGDFLHAELEARDFIFIWNPGASGETFEADDVTTAARADVLVIALNAGAGANINAIGNFVPPGREFAIALSGEAVQTIIDDTRADNEFADSDLPRRMAADGNDVDLTDLDVFLVNGAIRMTGEVTVIDAILDSIDVDAEFTVDVGLRWDPNGALDSAGVQMMDHFIISEDIDPQQSVLLWVITAILVVLTLGAGSVLLAIVVVVVALIVQAIAENIGGRMLVDGVTGALSGITAWPPELSRIGRVRAVFHDPITIDTTGLVMSGLLDVISSCEATDVVPADSGSAYVASAATALTLIAQNTHSDASYEWLPGDGSALASSQSKLHTYVASGLYVAKHQVRINQPGGAASRHFALVEVRNVVPTVDAGPDLTVDEGEVVTLVGHFEDVEYPDTHESIWNFGDKHAPKPGTIHETNDPPTARGTSTVQHAWCDNGVYTVTLRVRDQNGGMAADTRTVTVRNVAPEVDAGPELYAYPCSVITLTARFTDPGWCDTHTGTWDFGDCTPPQPALIEETHEPPKGEGTATASHVYSRCGIYHVTAVVVDDDGGEGQDSTVIRVVDVRNKDFEGGFRVRSGGTVANEWEPYVTVSDSSDEATHSTPDLPVQAGVFSCEKCVVHGGQRSQHVRVPTQGRAGIYQKVGANPGWDYQVTVWYSIAERTVGAARLGLDPSGRVDPSAESVVWSSGADLLDWTQLMGRITARSDALTIFLDADRGGRGSPEIYFDDVSLLAIQPFCSESEPDRPPVRERVCVDFKDFRPGTELAPVLETQGFIFQAQDKQVLEVVGWGLPIGQSKLHLRAGGLFVQLPCIANWVRITGAFYSGPPLTVLALGSDGQVVAQAVMPPEPEMLHTLEIQAPATAALIFRGGGGEGLLYEVCVRCEKSVRGRSRILGSRASRDRRHGP